MRNAVGTKKMALFALAPGGGHAPGPKCAKILVR